VKAFASIVVLLAACTSGPFHAPLVLGGRSYDAATLNHGFRVYQQNCRACHGDRGDGHGLSSTGMWPPPRDFSQGVFKFGRVPAPDLPPDTELARILRDGLNGTGMLAWRLSDADLDAVIGYVKTFSPRWRSEQPGQAVTAPSDPIATLDETAQHAAVVRGEALYHGKALCSSCHPAYVTRAHLYELTRALGTPVPQYSPAMYASHVKDTEFCWSWHSPAGADPLCDEPVRAVPPDFTHDLMRSIRKGSEASDLFATLAAGVSGAGMPPWRGALSDAEIWDLAWYVRSLALLRGGDEGAALRARLTAPDNAAWQSPTP